MMNKNFIFFGSWEKYLETVEEDRDEDYANKVARAIIQYALYGEFKTTDESIIKKVKAVCADLIESTQKRYTASVSNGYKGGRPPKSLIADIHRLHEEGLSVMEIAEQLSTNTRLVEKTIKNDN